MRKIEISENLRVRFKARGVEFDDGVEIGVVISLIESGVPEFARTTPSHLVEEMRALAGQLGYRILVGASAEDACRELHFLAEGRRPNLAVIRSH